MVVAKNMIPESITIIDEYPHDRQELEDLYYRELEDRCTVWSKNALGA